MTGFHYFKRDIPDFDNLCELLDLNQLIANYIYNMDETVVPRSGFWHIGTLTSAKTATLITMAIAVSASGKSIPPLFIFTSVHSKEHFLLGAPL